MYFPLPDLLLLFLLSVINLKLPVLAPGPHGAPLSLPLHFLPAACVHFFSYLTPALVIAPTLLTPFPGMMVSALCLVNTRQPGGLSMLATQHRTGE